MIKRKPSQTKFEIAEVNNHFFKYEYLNIPKEYLNNENKIYAYFALIGDRGIKRSDKPSEEINCSSLELIISLKKHHIIEFDKTVNKLIYKNTSRSDKYGLSDSYMEINVLTLHNNPDMMKYARKSKYIRI